ncbi:DUF5642 family protein [Mycolicibacterium pulveris]|uniref:DUF5642 family protein n=1 Tax=Mycolicibacterium pulveris TaxID=36813 RepID=UPI003CF29593
MLRAMVAAVVLTAAACATPPAPPPTSTTERHVNPARVDRVRGQLPPGYEFGGVADAASPAALWGYGPGWTADPPRCAALADPVPAATTTAGWSASGSGGIVYVVVLGAPEPVNLDAALRDECLRWTVSGGQGQGVVTITPAPTVDAATTVATVTDSTTLVEGGTQTRSYAYTATAYLGSHVAFVVVVTDPGSPNPQLGQEFAAGLLVETVSSLRG